MSSNIQSRKITKKLTDTKAALISNVFHIYDTITKFALETVQRQSLIRGNSHNILKYFTQ